MAKFPFLALTALVGAAVGAVVGGIRAAKSGKSVWKGALRGAAIGGLVGLGAGAAAGALLAGSAMATIAAVAIWCKNAGYGDWRRWFGCRCIIDCR